MGNTTSALSANRQGHSTLLAGTTSALSATRWGPDPNKPTRWAVLKESGTNQYSWSYKTHKARSWP